MPFGMQLCYWSISLWLGVGRREFSVLRCVCLEIDFEFAVLLVVFWCNKHFPSWASKLGEFEELYKTGKQSRFCTTFGNPPYAASVCLRQRNKYFFTYSHQNKLIDQWKRAYNRKYFYNYNALWKMSHLLLNASKSQLSPLVHEVDLIAW